MKNLFAAIALLALSGCGVYTVETGNVAVERTLGSVDHDEIGQGLHFKLPLITTHVGGIPEIFGPQKDLLLPPDDADSVAKAMRKALQDPARRAALPGRRDQRAVRRR